MIDLPNTVLILGSSALKIGEAGEFDYSGSQAIKALKEEGVRTVLINPNIATIQTSEGLADEIYFLPITPEFVEQVIAKEKPDGLLLAFGGQTALNCGVKLFESGALEKHNVRVLGTQVPVIQATEDRDLFNRKLAEVDAKSAQSKAVNTVDDAVAYAHELGFPVMCRVAYALGGLGSGIVGNEEELRELVGRALAHAPQVLIEESLKGWKEIEYEVVRDKYDNCITVCNMENFDPLGIHTGESIVVAPSQTLTNSEYHKLREIATRVIRHLGIVGECNIQYALDPVSEDYRIIEVNARLSRSSALASKATGYPLAFVAAKLALGYGLHELKNMITRKTSAFFEPALDYCVVKIPRWDLKKFKGVSRKIGSGMKSVGEVMAIAPVFEEALQKAVRMLEIGAVGVVGSEGFEADDLDQELSHPTEERLFTVAQALEEGYSVDQIYELSKIDKWFLARIERMVRIRKDMNALGAGITGSNGRALLTEAKRAGFSDKQIAQATGVDENAVYDVRHNTMDGPAIVPVVRQIDTLAGEFPAQTNYLYLTYNGVQDDAQFPVDNAVLLLGSGAYRIGCSVEFDWCCVNAGQTLKKLGYKAVMLNYNPETVSTDYDEFHQLFFDEISLETCREISEKVEPVGVIVSMGGQTPNNLAMKLEASGIKVLGTSPEKIDNAENRHRFSATLDELGVDQPEWAELSTYEEAVSFADTVGYPVLVRPSYVLSGAAMAVASNHEELEDYLGKAAKVSAEYPTVVSKFITGAKEIEFDAVAKNGEIVVYAISEHVENAGVHSGDATLVFPPQRTYFETVRRVRQVATQIARALDITGPFNMQFIAKSNAVKVIECNLRASRSFPFVSKVLRQNFIDLATRVIMDRPYKKPDKQAFDLNHVGVKAPQFSFHRLDGADPTLGVEMASTGEVGCIGEDFNEAFLKSLLSVGYRLPITSVLLSLGPVESKAEMLPAIRTLEDKGVAIYATQGTAKFLKEAGVNAIALDWPIDEKTGEPIAGAGETTVEAIRAKKVDLVINIPKNDQKVELTNGYMIRRAAVDYNVPLFTNRQLAQRFVEAIAARGVEDLAINSWGEHAMV